MGEGKPPYDDASLPTALVHQPVGLAQALWHDLNPPQVSDQLALKF
jgi:hypothetical protein